MKQTEEKTRTQDALDTYAEQILRAMDRAHAENDHPRFLSFMEIAGEITVAYAILANDGER